MNIPASVLKQLEARRDPTAVAKRRLWALCGRVGSMSCQEGPIGLVASVVGKELQDILKEIEDAEKT